mmetsp:Transcript_33470/g.80835  ORF Transcript_33470/g.80835 Transcript_33470/m.80835 type:complete len:674 (-) Transcript_33470:51-2072(-)
MQLCVFAAMASVAAGAQSDSAIAKVISLLQNMSDKGKAEMQEEQVKFAKFSEFCDNTRSRKEKAIAAGKETLGELRSEIGQLEAQIEELGRDINGLSKDISKWTGEMDQAKADRAQEHKEYLAQLQDFTESVDALERVITELKANAKAAPKMLLQLSTTRQLPAAAQRVIQAFLAEDPEDAQEIGMLQGPPEANAFESSTGGIIDMLEKLKDKFRGEKGDLEKEEMNAQHSFDMVIQDYRAQVKQAEKSKADKERRSQNKSQRRSAAEGEVADTTADLNEDESYLADLNSECTDKHEAFASRQTLRKEEIEALEQAMEVLRQPEMSVDGETARDKRYGLSQTGTSFAQLRSSVKSPLQGEVVAMLSAASNKLQSKVLAQLAERCSEDVFSNVKKMIRDMMRKLQQEAEEEAEHKGWCDTELGTNKQTRDTKTDALDELNSDIDELEATISKLRSESGDLEADVAAINKAVEEAQAQRDDEQKKNAVTVAEAKEGKIATNKALKVLREFYRKAGKATVLTQSRKDVGAPETFSEPYTGMQGANGGVVGLLEVIVSDFAKIESRAAQQEKEAEKEHQAFLVESKRDVAVKSRDAEHRRRQADEAESTLVRRQQEKASTTEELEAAERYYEKLRPSCVDEGVSYEERTGKREEEIKSLKEALTLLNGGVDFSGRSK